LNKDHRMYPGGSNDKHFKPVQVMMTRRRAWLDILLVPVLVAVSGLSVALLAEVYPGAIPLPLLIVLQGLAILAGLSLLLARAGQGWGDVGLHAIHGRDLGRGLFLLAACLGGNLLLMLFVRLAVPGTMREHIHLLQEISSRLIDGLPFTVIAATLFFVGVYEELTARGFLLSRCLAALDGVWAPVLLSALLFGLGHVYQGWIGVVQTMMIGVIFAISTVRWGTLWPAILAHALLNTLSVAALAGLDAGKSILVWVLL
jgi:membrane protease YdiL (CAAX protease family)